MKVYPVSVLCAVMKVSRSGFYDHLNRKMPRVSDGTFENELNNRVKAIFKASKGSYGSRRVLKQLQSEGHQLGRFKVRRIMRDLGLRAKRSRRYKVTTNSRHKYTVACNLLDRNFNISEANRVWTADITYVWTLEGWLYLAVVMDLFSRQVVGWAMDKRMSNKLTLDAIKMAYWRRKPPKGLLHHSDRGTQYASYKYQTCLQKYGMEVSMSRKGNCWDNSPMERFFGSLKSERLDSCRFISRKAAEIEILDYMAFYNSDRLHSTLGYQSPMTYEKEQLQKTA